MAVDHTPTQPTPPGDDRPLRLLERTPVPQPHKDRLFHVVRRGQADASKAGAELQAEFGAEHVALIVGCNQFVRLFRGGPEPGAVELLVPDDQKKALAANGFTLRDPAGQVFKLFGWVRLDPMQGDPAALDAAVDAAFTKAHSAKKTK